MKDTTKTLIEIIESLSVVSEKQGQTLELLANKLPGLSNTKKANILKSADEMFSCLGPLSVALDTLRK